MVAKLSFGNWHDTRGSPPLKCPISDFSIPRNKHALAKDCYLEVNERGGALANSFQSVMLMIRHEILLLISSASSTHSSQSLCKLITYLGFTTNLAASLLELL